MRGARRSWGRLLLLAPVVLAVTAGALRMAAPSSATAQQAEEAGDPEAGRAIYERYCAVCHGPDGKGSFRGPDITETGTASVDFMVRTGRMPLARPNERMRRRAPAFSEAEIRDLVAYAGTFVTGPAVPTDVDISRAELSMGAATYLRSCAPCHQSVGAGGALANGGVAPPPVAATPREMIEAMRTGPGNMPIFPPGVLSDADATAVASYVNYLKQPEDPGGLGLWHLGPVPEGLVAWGFGVGGALLLCRWLGVREPPRDQ